MRCFHPVKLKDGKFYPCGQCVGCRINRTSAWTVRLMAESRSWDSTIFVTLTYDDEHLKSASLVPEDLTKFFKRLRKDLKFENRNIKYYACGEYGQFIQDKTGTFKKNGRPHFHIIIFGMDSSKHDRQLIAENWPFCPSVKFMDSRCKGVVLASRECIQYVCGYVQKKLYGNDSKFYEDLGLIPPFSRCSQGLGLSYFKDNEFLIDKENISIKLWNGKELVLPRYLRDKMDLPFDTDKLNQKMCKDVLKAHPEIDRKTWLNICRHHLLGDFYQALQAEDSKNELEAFYVRHKIRR